ncbi:hypothetical protein GN244_ATG12872 [Phytophthora infestans]|uniref:Uncharacterized protein n=1 Tax=Phytophthora infestans TaxID=4787 RepID=A0A833SIQ4_PHYIN|nr:hypothetical protein GN244_ATG12872 [Phytophthora infestans]KAF4134725.1 hypothetical protein GN958_ATG15981 [Phytophthora infestans]
MQRTDGNETSVVNSTTRFGLDTEAVSEDTTVAGDMESDIGIEQQSCTREDRSALESENDDQHDALVSSHQVELA